MEEAAYSELVAANLGAVRDRIAGAAREAGRPADAVTLVAVSKTHPQAAVRAALAAGQRVFGENRVQEALAKFPQLRRRISRSRTASDRAVADQQGQGRGGALRRDRNARSPPSRRGAGARDRADRPPDNLLYRGQYRRGGAEGRHLPRRRRRFHPRLPRPPRIADRRADVHPARAAEEPALHFALLREIAKRNGLAVLSMGMSADFETAIRFGATHVRVGTAIFGARRAAVASDMAAG